MPLAHTLASLGRSKSKAFVFSGASSQPTSWDKEPKSQKDDVNSSADSHEGSLAMKSHAVCFQMCIFSSFHSDFWRWSDDQDDEPKRKDAKTEAPEGNKVQAVSSLVGQANINMPPCQRLR